MRYPRSFYIFICWASLILAAGPNLPASSALEISSGPNAVVLKDGKPFRAIGVNYFDCFLRTLEDGNDTSYEDGFAVLGARGIPFVRFCAAGFWPKDMSLYQTDRAEYFRRLDRVVDSAGRHGIGMFPSLFWFYPTVPDLVGEPVNAWGNPHSKTRAFMRNYVREVVTRYRQNPTIWGWEFGNEYSLAASLPNAGEHRPPVVPQLGTPASRSAEDELTFSMVREAFEDFAREVRKYDPTRRPLITGDSILRDSAWHQEHESSWKSDTPDQFAQMLKQMNPDPINCISLHLYEPPQWRRLSDAIEIGHKLNKPLFVGEFGVPGQGADAQAEFRRQIKQIIDSDVPLAALWVFDYRNQKDFSVTQSNARSWQLDLIVEANRKLNAR